MDITKSQSDFEAWFKSEFIVPASSLTLSPETFKNAVQKAYQAGRESIEVERISPTDVPPDVVYQLDGAGLSPSMTIREAYSTGFNAALRTAGIRIKGESE
ncbi:hypothetical protein DVP68_23310 [Yersinia enterocolitica]|nr:hypothetical protein [Yersinia enterocolitica]EKN6369438.1 hypothetical protein [Yersinia enterocolitica]